MQILNFIPIQFQQKKMSFLKRFEGKTQTLKKQQVSEILGNNQKQNKTPKIVSKTAKIISQKMSQSKSNVNLSKNTKSSPISNALNDNNKKPALQNPFLIQNNFYLSQQEHQNIVKIKRQKQIQQLKQRQIKQKQERKERERLKKIQLQRKVQQQALMRKSVSKGQYVPPIKNRQWIKLGGLGPNVGGQQWTQKKDLQDKMLKFAQQIKKINLQRHKHLKHRPSLQNGVIPDARPSLQNGVIPDARTLGLVYSKSIPKPSYYQLQLSKSQMKNTSNYYSQQFNQKNNQEQSSFQETQLKSYERQHQRYKNLVQNQF